MKKWFLLLLFFIPSSSIFSSNPTNSPEIQMLLFPRGELCLFGGLICDPNNPPL